MQNWIKAICLWSLVILPVSVAADGATGVWRSQPTEQGHIEITIQPCGATLCGVITRAINTQGQAGDFAHLGRRMIWDMSPVGQNRWSGGKIWDPIKDKTYSSKLELKGSALHVSGCVLGFCQARIWQRVR